MSEAGRRDPSKVPSRVAASKQGKDMYMAQPGLNIANATETTPTTPAVAVEWMVVMWSTGVITLPSTGRNTDCPGLS